ncbi:MAG: YihY/virulence factor BrkB family protein [Anaerovoracaceae bacterium]
MSKQRFWRMVTLGIRQFRDPYYQGFAAQMSFYFILAMVPLLILVSQLLGLFHVDFMDVFGTILQGSHNALLERIYTYMVGNKWSSSLFNSNPGFNTVVYIFIILWASSGAQFSLMRITNFMYTEGKSTGRGYFRERFRAIINMLIFLIIIIFALTVLIFGGRVVEALNYNNAEEAIRIWKVVRWPIAFVLYFLLISTNYYFMPTDKLQYRQILPGSIFASVGMVVVTMIYSSFMRISANSIVYGVLANIVAIMTWFYFLSWVLCLGTLFNKVWMDTAQGKSYYDL